MFIAELLPNISGAALNSLSTKDSLVAALAMVTKEFVAKDLVGLSLKDLKYMANLLQPGVPLPSTKEAVLEALCPVFRRYASFPSKAGLLPARIGNKMPSAVGGAIGTNGASSHDADEEDEVLTSDESEVDGDDDAADDPPSASEPVSADMFRVLLTQVDRLAKAMTAQANAAATSSQDNVANLVTALTQLRASASTDSYPASLSPVERLRESRMVRDFFGVDSLLADVLPDSVTSDVSRFQEARDLLESIHGMDSGHPISYVQRHRWQHSKYRGEALRWADTIQDLLDQVSVDVSRFADFLFVLKKPVWRIHALIRYDETGDDSFMDAVTPLAGSFLAPSLRAELEARREAIASRSWSQKNF
jgi:hypothetical protein